MDSSKSLGQLINSMPRVNFNDEVIANPLFAELATKAKITQLVALAQALGLSQSQIDAILAL